MEFDFSQQSIFEFDTRRHATVLGAAGTGKTQIIVELISRQLATTDLDSGCPLHSLALVNNRRAGEEVRKRVERQVDVPIQGSVVRTPTSLAFMILAHLAAEDGTPVPRLVTGAEQDEAIAAALIEDSGLNFARELHEAQPFRAELRNLWRLCDDYDMSFEQLDKFALGVAQGLPLGELPSTWSQAATVLAAAAKKIDEPSRYTASGVLRSARRVVRELDDSTLRSILPARLLIDDAQDLTEGALGLVAECAARGTVVWGFGDPDLATSAFQGERTNFVTSVVSAMERKLHHKYQFEEQRAVLTRVHRGDAQLRQLAQTVSQAIGTAQAGQQRAAISNHEAFDTNYIESAVLAHRSEMIGAIAHRLREAHFGVHNADPMDWGQMAIICRSRAQAQQIARELVFKEVPTRLVGGGIVLREHRIIRDLVALTDFVLSGNTPSAHEFFEFLSGPLGGLDEVQIRKLKSELLLQERKDAHSTGREALRSSAVIENYLRGTGDTPIIDSASGRAVQRLARGLHTAAALYLAGATAREVAWVFWEGAKLSEKLQDSALFSPSQAVRAEAHQTLDAVLAFMFVLERAEDDRGHTRELLSEIMHSDVPEDTLAATGVEDAVIISTPQGVLGHEYELVVLAELQEGAWPNLQPRRGMLGLPELERSVRGEEVITTERIDTLHDELRLLLYAITRSTGKIFTVCVDSADEFKSSFWQYFTDNETESVPTSGLTLRGTVASLRRRLESNPEDREAAQLLAYLAEHKVAGADPDTWYGIRDITTAESLTQSSETGEVIRLSPSQMANAETCPLSWAVNTLAGRTATTIASGMGTLLHAAFEQAIDGESDAASLQAFMKQHWDKLPFAATWDAERQERMSQHMAEAIEQFVQKQSGDAWKAVAREVAFSFQIGHAKMSGKIDRIEARDIAGETSVKVVDLKTGRNALSISEAESDAQLMAYQYAIESGNLELDIPKHSAAEKHIAGASLLYVHPSLATAKLAYRLREQPPMNSEMRAEFETRVTETAEKIVGPEYLAQVEHHCLSDQGGSTSCAIHLVPAVSFE